MLRPKLFCKPRPTAQNGHQTVHREPKAQKDERKPVRNLLLAHQAHHTRFAYVRRARWDDRKPILAAGLSALHVGGSRYGSINKKTLSIDRSGRSSHRARLRAVG